MARDMADTTAVLQLTRGMRRKICSSLDQCFHEWQFQLQTNMAVMSATMSSAINTPETITAPNDLALIVPGAGVELQRGACLILRRIVDQNELEPCRKAVLDIDAHWDSTGNVRDYLVVQDEWQT